MTRATKAGMGPMPKTGIIRPKIANEGKVCIIPVSCVITAAIRGLRLMNSPKGKAMSMARHKELTDSSKCWMSAVKRSCCRSIKTVIRLFINITAHLE